MLYTNLKHIESADKLAQIISEHENVVVICGRMDPMCVPVYRIAEELEGEYSQVKFFDMEFDNPESQVIRALPEVRSFMGIPFTIYYKNGQVVKATTGIQNKAQIIRVLDNEYSEAIAPSPALPQNREGSFDSATSGNVSLKNISSELAV
ncbi:MAG: thioredoxin family protein [Bacteroidota bacterium]|nr:thioredoxin family protein [Bacteroidota bacterium]